MLFHDSIKKSSTDRIKTPYSKLHNGMISNSMWYRIIDEDIISTFRTVHCTREWIKASVNSMNDWKGAVNDGFESADEHAKEYMDEWKGLNERRSKILLFMFTNMQVSHNTSVRARLWEERDRKRERVCVYDLVGRQTKHWLPYLWKCVR